MVHSRSASDMVSPYRRSALTWNGHGCCGKAQRENIDDVGFITTMVGQISAGLPIDKSRVYATGISNGGIMSYALACNSGITG
jgi:polyhydroxybutyrate depolymerase